MTKQRQVILEELRKVKTHPTAYELCALVRDHLPRVSLGTIYRNLDILSRQERINKIEVGGEEMRFDGNTSPHYHLRCLQCGKVYDIELPIIEGLEAEVEKLYGVKVQGHNLEFVGRCHECL
jgi:Fur family ferric uptake transcriptional regulator